MTAIRTRFPMPQLVIVWCSVCCLGMLPLGSLAQDGKPPDRAASKPAATPAATAGDSDPKLEVSVFPRDKYRYVTGGFDIYLTVTNTTPDSIVHRDIAVCFPRAIWSVIGATVTEENKRAAASVDGPSLAALARQAQDYRPCQRATKQTPTYWKTLQLKDRDGKDIKVPTFDLPRGRQAYFHISVPEVKDFALDWLRVRRDNYDLKAFYIYQLAGDNLDVTREVRIEVPVELRPSLIAPLSGVLVGTMLIAVFIAIRAAKKEWEKPAVRGKARLRDISLGFAWTAVRVTVVGVISGMILVVVLNQTDTAQLPVTVTINDFWGGAFLGLLAYKLADWLEEKFFVIATK